MPLTILYGYEMTRYIMGPQNGMVAPDRYLERVQLLVMVAAALSFCQSPSKRAALCATSVEGAVRLGAVVAWQPLWWMMCVAWRSHNH